MHVLMFSGVLFAVSVTFLLGGGFFVEAWRYQRDDRAYVLFGLATMALSVYAGAAAGIYLAVATGAEQSSGWLLDLGFAASTPSAAMLLHFAMQHTGRRYPTAIYASYALAAVTVLIAVLGYWRVPGSWSMRSVEIFGVTLPAVQAHTTWLGSFFVGAALVMIAATSGLLILRNVRQRSKGRRGDGGALLVGSVLLLACGVHDATALGLGLFDSVSVLPLGFITFVYGVATTLVTMYGRATRALAVREVELSAQSEKLASSLAELQQAQEELLHSEQLAVVGEFAAVITHEVRNPMAIVNNAVTTLRHATAATDDTRSLLGIIEEEMLRLERLVTHLLNYARPVVPQRQAVELSELIEGCLVGPMEVNEDVDCTVECDGEWPTVYVDHDLMQQAIENIIVNAIQAMDGRGELTVRVARRHVDGVRAIVIGFEDTGEGMTEHQLEQAASPFYSTRPAGTGLGLAICERTVDAHGGRLVLDSDHGVGTAVSIILPEKPDQRLYGARRPSSLPPMITRDPPTV